MLFAAPIWLLGLLPWAAVTLYVLLGRRLHKPVPFLPLWRTGAVYKRAERSWHRPPPGVVAMILAILFAILAAAGPAVRRRGNVPLTIVVDRGWTMSAQGKSRPRFIEAAAELSEAFHGVEPGHVTLVDLLTGERSESNWPDALHRIESLDRTAIDTAPLIRPAILGELARSTGPVVLLGDHPAEVEVARFHQMFPRASLSNVGIRALAAREPPSPQVMVTLRNDSLLKEAELVVSTDGEVSRRRVAIAEPGTESNHFIDLPRLGEVIEVKLNVADDMEADNTAWLVRDTRGGRAEIRGIVPDAVRRMAEVYARVRRPRADWPVVAVVNTRADLPAGGAGIIVGSPVLPHRASGDLRIVDHPVTAVIHWSEVVKSVDVGGKAPEDWLPLVVVDGQVLVAAREEPARQVWVGFDSTAWQTSADFVVFWTNVFDWTGSWAEAFTSHPVGLMGEAWNREWKRRGPPPPRVRGDAWPGLFERADGATVAVNAPSPALTNSPDSRANPQSSDGRSFQPIQETFGIGRWISLLAMVFAVLALILWRPI